MTAQTERGWLQVAEKGSVFGIWLLIVIMGLLGRGVARGLLWFIALWYATLNQQAVRHSRRFLERVLPDVGWRHAFRHLHTFAQVTLDRLLLVQGKVRGFDVYSTGREHLEQLHADGRGAILLGAHLGSFEAMRAKADDSEFTINVVGYFRNAQRFNAVLEKLNPGLPTRFIGIEPDNIAFMLKIRERIEAGELVAMLGDRVDLGKRQAEVEFLGAPARFPTGAYLMAATLRCPVYLVFGLYEGGRRYHLVCEPFAERIVLPRGQREDALCEYAARYAQRLEHYARLAPYNWFNFYDFWKAAP